MCAYVRVCVCVRKTQNAADRLHNIHVDMHVYVKTRFVMMWSFCIMSVCLQHVHIKPA